MSVFRLLRNDLGFVPQRVACAGLFIGRALANELVLNDIGIAEVHAGICFYEGHYWLSNFAEAETNLNGQAITHVPLESGDVIEIGLHALVVTQLTDVLQIEVNKLAPAHMPEMGLRPALTPEIEAGLNEFWQPLRDALSLPERTAEEKPNPKKESAPESKKHNWLKLSLLIVLLVVGAALLVALVYPRAFASGAISKAHTPRTIQPLPQHALKPITSSCMNCHQLNHAMQSNCTSCHSTNNFQPVVAAKHEALKLECVLCHHEHRGEQAKLKQVENSTCTNCHQAAAAKAFHGLAVQYPVNKFGVWSWDGLSQAQWQQHQLRGATADFTLREQFHMLHAEGRAQGRTRCTDCHLGGTEGATLKQNVRESCAQCHTLAPTLANEIAAQAKRAPLKQGTTLCVACHAQHGSERDALASVRKE